MKSLLFALLITMLTGCSANVSAPDMALPELKNGGELPAPTSNTAHFDGKDFIVAKAVMMPSDFYENYYRILLLPAETTSACSSMHNQYVEVNVPMSAAEAKVTLSETGTYAQMLLYYDLAGGTNKNIGIGNGWHQIKDFATANPSITLNVSYGTDFIQGTYSIQKCF